MAEGSQTAAPVGEEITPPDDAEQQRIAEARVKTGDFIARLMMTYAAFMAFCAFTLLSPDKLMILPQASLNMPFAGNVSFLAFMLVAPFVLIGTRVYLEVYVQRWHLLDRELTPQTEPKTLSPLKHPLLRVFSAIVLYPLLPAILALFTWKAAAKDVWGDAFFGVAVVCVVVQVARLIPWPSADRWAMSVMGALVGGGLVANEVVPHRGLDLFREDLKGAYLPDADLSGADLSSAKLKGAYLPYADLSGADLSGADLSGADLSGAKLKGADLSGADLSGALLSGAKLEGANLSGVNLKYARLLERSQLYKACAEPENPPRYLPGELDWRGKPCPEKE